MLNRADRQQDYQIQSKKRIENKILLIKPQIKSCEICLCDMDEKSQWNLQCKHTYHKACLETYFKTEIQNKKFPIKCPDQKGSHEINQEDIKQILDKNDYEKYENFLMQFYIDYHSQSQQLTLIKMIYRCLTPDCENAYIMENNFTKFSCSVCLKEYCLKCQCEYHNNQTCEEYQKSESFKKQDSQFEEFVKDKELKQCRKCQRWVEKIEGCNHMTCFCGYKFCYLCGGIQDSCECVKKFNEAYERLNPTKPKPSIKTQKLNNQQKLENFQLKRNNFLEENQYKPYIQKNNVQNNQYRNPFELRMQKQNYYQPSQNIQINQAQNQSNVFLQKMNINKSPVNKIQLIKEEIKEFPLEQLLKIPCIQKVQNNNEFNLNDLKPPQQLIKAQNKYNLEINSYQQKTDQKLTIPVTNKIQNKNQDYPKMSYEPLLNNQENNQSFSNLNQVVPPPESEDFVFQNTQKQNNKYQLIRYKNDDVSKIRIQQQKNKQEENKNNLINYQTLKKFNDDDKVCFDFLKFNKKPQEQEKIRSLSKQNNELRYNQSKPDLQRPLKLQLNHSITQANIFQKDINNQFQQKFTNRFQEQPSQKISTLNNDLVNESNKLLDINSYQSLQKNQIQNPQAQFNFERRASIINPLNYQNQKRQCALKQNTVQNESQDILYELAIKSTKNNQVQGSTNKQTLLENIKEYPQPLHGQFLRTQPDLFISDFEENNQDNQDSNNFNLYG